MTSSQRKRSWWVYVLIAIMLFALIGFSVLPLLSSVQQKQIVNTRTTATTIGPEQAQLKAEALGYQLVLEREPDNETALRGLLETKLKQGDFQGATVPLEKMAQRHPEQTNYAVLLAQVKRQLRDFEGAVEAYRQALTFQPADIEALREMTDLFLQQNRAEDAIAFLQDTLKKASQTESEQFDAENTVSVQLLLGLVYEIKERYSSAIALYDQILESQPEDFRPLLAKGLVLRKQGKDEQAQPLIEQAVSLAPPAYKEQIRALVTQAEAEDAA